MSGSPLADLLSRAVCRARKGEPYKFVPVSAFFEAYQRTQCAQSESGLLAKPYAPPPEATDPLVRLSVPDAVVIMACHVNPVSVLGLRT